jgi:hypothetical protein
MVGRERHLDDGFGLRGQRAGVIQNRPVGVKHGVTAAGALAAISNARLPARLRCRTALWWRRCGLVCLMCAVFGCGLSASLRTMLGPMHWHAVAHASGGSEVAPTHLFDNVRQWLHSQRASLRLATHKGAHADVQHLPAQLAGARQANLSSHSHAHDAAGRHHHDVSDGSVVTLDGGAAASDEQTGGASGTLPVFALPAASHLPPRSAVRVAWQRLDSRLPNSAPVRRLERPPRG